MKKLEEGKVLSVAKEEEKPKENRVDLEHVVGECLKQLQAQANVGREKRATGECRSEAGLGVGVVAKKATC